MKAIPALIPTLILTIPITVFAQEQSAESETLEPTIVTGSRTPTSISDTPYTAYLLSEKELSEHSVRNIPDAFLDVPGVLVQKTAHAQGSPYIRGFTGRQNLILVDGIRVNNSTWRSGPVQYWNTIDNQNVASLEVIKSQGSVLYGSDAIGGTVNLISKSSNFENEHKNDFFIHGRAHYRFDTNSESHVGRLETKFGQGQRWAITLGASVKDFGDIRDSALGVMKGTGYSEETFDFKFETLIDKYSNTKFTLAHQYLNQDDISRWHRTINNPGWIHGNHITTPGTFLANDIDQERSFTYARLEGETKNPWLSKYQATLSYQKTQDSEFQFRNDDDIRNQNIDLQTFGIDLQAQAEINNKTTLTYGFDYYRDEVDSFGTRERLAGTTDLRPLADNSTYDSLGVFAQLNYKPNEKWEITPGIRYSYARANLGEFITDAGVESTSESWDQLVAELRAIHHINSQWSIYGGVSQAFRAPNLNDLTGNLTTQSGVEASGSLDVDPETATTFELGTRFKNDKLSLQVSTFYTRIEDQIGDRLLTSGESVTTNNEDGFVFGFEADLTYQINNNWEWRIFASAQDSQIETANAPDGEPFSRNAPFMGGTSLRWTHSDDNFWIEGRVQASATADRLSVANENDSQRIPTNGTPSYAILSLHTGYDITENINLTLSLENLLDDDYRLHGSGQNQPGRNLIVGLTYTF